MSWGYGYREYVPVAKKKSLAKKLAEKSAKAAGRKPQPVQIAGSKIATTFWGKAWCDNLEHYSDFANRLPRGRTYVRNGSVVDLQISTGRLDAIVAGSEPYRISASIDPLKPAEWRKIRRDCSASIDSLIDLLSGRFSDGVMQRLTQPKDGMFPSPKEIRLRCSCPDGAWLCKHLAAVLYGVGSHLDHSPELLFLLRGVDHTQLISEAASAGNLTSAFGQPSSDLLDDDLGAIFGIELDDVPATEEATGSRRTPPAANRKAAGRKSTKRTRKKQPVKKSARKSAKKKTAEKKSKASKAVAKKKSAKKKTNRKAAKTTVRRTSVKTRAKKPSSAAAKKTSTKRVAKKGLAKKTTAKRTGRSVR